MKETISIQRNGGRIKIPIETIYSLQSFSNYTKVTTTHGMEAMSGYTLKTYEEKCNNSSLLRVNNGLIINTNFVTTYYFNNEGGSYLKLIDGTKIRISRARLPLVRSFFKEGNGVVYGIYNKNKKSFLPQ